MPLLFFLIIVALVICASSYRWRRTPEQRKDALRSLQRDFGGEIEDYLEGAALRFQLQGLPAELRLYALPKEPLAVSTELLLDLPAERSPQLGTLEFEWVADRLMPSLKHAIGGRLDKYRFSSLFRSLDGDVPSEDSAWVEPLMRLWRLGPPRHVRFCVREGKMMLSKDMDLCEQAKLQRFVAIGQSLLDALSKTEGVPRGNASE